MTMSSWALMIQKLWPAAFPLLTDNMAPIRLASGSPSTRRATGISAIASVRKIATPVVIPSCFASSARIGFTTLVLYCTRASRSDSVGLAPR